MTRSHRDGTRRGTWMLRKLAMVLQDVGYGSRSEIVGFDLYPYTEDQVAAVRQAILNWEFIWDLASKIDRRALADARARADAIAGVRTVYRALGLDTEYEAEVVRRRQKRREASRRKAPA